MSQGPRAGGVPVLASKKQRFMAAPDDAEKALLKAEKCFQLGCTRYNAGEKHKARKLFEQAGDHPEAQYRLGSMLLKGDGVDSDEEEVAPLKRREKTHHNPITLP